MGSWGDESCALLEPQNAIDKDVLSNGICHDQNDVKVDVEVGVVNGGGDECRDHESNVVTEEGTLVQQFERLEFRNNESDGAKIEEVNREEKQGEYDDGKERKNQVYPLRLYAVDCSHYLKTGFCKFGQNCRFNHPSLRVYQPVTNKDKIFEQSNGFSGDAGRIDKDVLSNGICHDQNDVKVDVEVGVVNGGGDECRDHESNVVTEEGTLVQQFERLEFRNNESDGAKIEEVNREEKQGEYDDGKERKNQVYPLRLYAVDCSHYLKTGTCKFGQNCRFNHPSLRVYQPVTNKDKVFEQSNGFSGDAGRIECKYQTQGRCKYGDACSYNHSAPKVDEERIKLNFLGLPLRPTAQECTFYLRSGSCAYGVNCRFHHPDPSPTKVPEPGNSLENGSSMRGDFNLPSNYAGESMQSFGGESHGTQELSNGMNVRDGLSYAPEMRSYHQTMAPTPGFNQSQVTSSFQANKFPLPHQVMNNLSKRVDPSAHYENLIQIDEFPLRPDQPDCDYFMKTGNCKYRSACRYNHPTRQASKLRLPPRISNGHYSRPAPMLPAETSQNHNPYSNSMKKNGMSYANHQSHQMENGEFPERPEQPECEYYMKTGQCKFFSLCRYHHPKNQVRTSTQCALNEKGLPLRPGAKLCRNYEQQGMCKYGVDCLYNHPDDYFTRSCGHTNTGPPTANNVKSAWDDGWGM